MLCREENFNERKRRLAFNCLSFTSTPYNCIFDIDKKDSDAVRYITILYPSKNTASFPIFKAKFLNKAFDENGVKIEISVGGKKRQLEYKL